MRTRQNCRLCHDLNFSLRVQLFANSVVREEPWRVPKVILDIIIKYSSKFQSLINSHHIFISYNETLEAFINITKSENHITDHHHYLLVILARSC